jgi:hypothetical protein
MALPRISDQIRDFASYFASIITAESTSPYDWVARTGDYSIFSFLSLLSAHVSNQSKSINVRYEMLMRRVYRRLEASPFEMVAGNQLFGVTISIYLTFLNSFIISERALNRHLESLGFRRVRVRMQCIVRFEGCMRSHPHSSLSHFAVCFTASPAHGCLRTADGAIQETPKIVFSSPR